MPPEKGLFDRTALADNTIIVFAGDHGFCGKGFHYDSVIRTPLLMASPGIAAGRRLDGMASTVGGANGRRQPPARPVAKFVPSGHEE